MSEQTQTKSKVLSSLDIVGLALIVLFIPIIIINFILVIKGAVHPEEVPMVFNSAPLIVISDSMNIDKETNTGAFNKGDLIIVNKVNPDDLEKGDIIAYITKEGDVVTHRITDVLEKDGQRVFETKGDQSPGYDYYAVKYSQIVGEYRGVRFAKLGDLAMFLQEPAGVIVVLGIPLVGIMALDIVGKQKETKASREKTAELEAELKRLKKVQEEIDSKKESEE